MSEEEIIKETKSIGTLLREHREQQGGSLKDVADVTRISMPVLQAMESDNFDDMPADAFCRGFYAMYANYLSMNPEKVVSAYLEARGISPIPNKTHFSPPMSNSGKFSNYAEPPSVSPAAGAGTLVLLTVAIIIGLCWFLNWNPVAFFQTQFEKLQSGSQQERVILTSLTESESSAGSAETKLQEETQDSALASTPYHLEIEFQNSGSIQVSLDDGLFIAKQHNSGQTLTWDIEKQIIIKLPETVKAAIKFNDITLPLPETVEGSRLLSLPEDILN